MGAPCDWQNFGSSDSHEIPSGIVRGGGGVKAVFALVRIPSRTVHPQSSERQAQQRGECSRLPRVRNIRPRIGASSKMGCDAPFRSRRNMVTGGAGAAHEGTVFWRRSRPSGSSAILQRYAPSIGCRDPSGDPSFFSGLLSELVVSTKGRKKFGIAVFRGPGAIGNGLSGVRLGSPIVDGSPNLNGRPSPDGDIRYSGGVPARSRSRSVSRIRRYGNDDRSSGSLERKGLAGRISGSRNENRYRRSGDGIGNEGRQAARSSN